MMNTSALLRIQQHVMSVDNEINYKDWVVCLSWKEKSQFLYDALVQIDHLIEIGRIDVEIEELESDLRAAGLKVVKEREPTNIFLYRSGY